MAKRTAEVLAALAFLTALGACNRPEVAYTTPGWYLQRPRQLVALGPQLFAGPMTYEQCEIERKKLPASTAENTLCNRLLGPPGRFGF